MRENETPARSKGGLPLHWKMAIGFAAGLAFGLAVNLGGLADAAWVQGLTTCVTQPVGTLFLRLIFMLVLPLLFSALVVGVAEMGWLQQVLAFGWRCRPLGLPAMVTGKLVGALRIEITGETPGLMQAAGTYVGDQVAFAELMPA